MLLSAFAAKTKCLFMSGLLHITALHPLSAQLLPSQSVPSLFCCQGTGQILSQLQDFTFVPAGFPKVPLEPFLQPV